MQQDIYVYNTLTRSKEKFEPINPPFAGIYVCGPTVYGDAHLGHARPAVTYDLVTRYLRHRDYKVRYVRNITDVGHLENDADEGEDKIAKKARLEQLEPMEVVQYFTNRYQDCMNKLNVLPPSIEPRASGHIIEQQKLVEEILEKGYAYEVNGSVYFDVEKYNSDFQYGKLSGRKIGDLLSSTRLLEGQQEKKSSLDFALWKKASPSHIMRWPSPWSDGFPGWHLECSAMSMKYLGQSFDIHGGGMDLLFPHHECEIAQNTVSTGNASARYWMHNNMVTINGQKMGKSLGNFITLEEFFTGKHDLLDQAFAPMTIRFFILQAHYRSTLDFSNEALKASEKGLERLLAAINILDKLQASENSTYNVQELRENCYKAMNDDFNSPIVIAHLFEGVKIIHAVKESKEQLSLRDLNHLKETFHLFVEDILGLKEEGDSTGNKDLPNELVDMILNIRQEAKTKKDFQTADNIRDRLMNLGIEVKDKKDGYEWSYK